MEKGEVVFRIKGPYGAFGLYETPLLGILASNSGWAEAARECKLAAGDLPVICFGARHLHPAVAPVMELAATVGGADGMSCILAGRRAGKKPQGTSPHALYLFAGDTLEGAKAYDMTMDIKEIEGKPIAKRGRIPGIKENSRLEKARR